MTERPSPTSLKGPLFLLGSVGLIVGFLIETAAGGIILLSLLVLLAACVVPSAATRRRRDLERRQRTFIEHVQSATVTTRADLERLLRVKEELGLSDEEAGSARVDAIRGGLEYVDFVQRVEAAGGRLPEVEGHERIVTPDTCFFTAPAFLDKRGPDEAGTLFLTSARLVFLGSTLTSVPWSKVAVLQRDGPVVLVQRRDRQTPYRVVMGGAGDAMKVEFIANAVLHTAGV
jgi:hypothetical protein